MNLCLRKHHSQQEALPTSMEGAFLHLPAFHPSFFRHCIAQTSESWYLKQSFAKCLIQNFSCLPSYTTLRGAIISHPALQRKSVSCPWKEESNSSAIRDLPCQCLLEKTTQEFHAVNHSLKLSAMV